MLHYLTLNKWAAILAIAVVAYGVRLIWRSLPAASSHHNADRRARRDSVAGAAIAIAGALLFANAAGAFKLPWNPAPASVSYSIPPGWTDMSPGSPMRERGEVPEPFGPAVAADHQALAFDWRPGEPAAARASMIATHHVGGPLSMELMQQFWAVKLAPLGKISLQSGPELITAGGTRYGRLLAHNGVPGGTAAMLVYFFETGPHSFSVMSFATAAESYDEYKSVFDATAQATISAGRQ